MELVLATRNEDKIREIKEILVSGEFQIYSLLDFPELPPILEDGKTLEENAFKKAKFCIEHTKMTSLADDTGLEVYALGGKPGVLSSRYAGVGATYEDNVRKLLKEMEDVPVTERGARFRCVVVIVETDGKIYEAEGSLEGKITIEPRGRSGFGYDPVFLIPSLGKTLAELSLEEKNRISHRGIAVRDALKKWLGA